MDYLTLLEQGIDQWNQWRASHPNAACSLKGKDLAQGYFFEGNFQGVDLRGANLQRACLVGANFQNADLTGANLSGAYLDDANFYGANLTNANFTKAALARVDMRRANLLGTQLTEVDLRSIKLPDPTEPYSVEAVFPVASPPTTQKQTVQQKTVQQQTVQQKPNKQQAVVKKTTTTATKLSQAEKHVVDKSDWMSRVMASFTVRSRESAKDIADRQQSIRLSAIPTHQIKKSVGRTQPLIAKKTSAKKVGAKKVGAKKVGAKKQKAKKMSTNRQIAPSQRPAKKTPVMQNAVRVKSPAPSDSLRSDQRLATLMGHSVRQKPSWMPILAAIGVVIAMGLPFAIPTLVNSIDARDRRSHLQP